MSKNFSLVCGHENFFENLHYFSSPKTLEELKKQYRKLAMNYHPDKGGNAEIMKIINGEYDEFFAKLKDVHENKDGETYTAKRTTSETAEQFKNIIDELMKMDNVTIEVIGCFVWVTGNTKIYKDKLKELKFQWHSKKTAWYLKPEDYKKRSHRDYDLEEIREMYGTNGAVNSKGAGKLAYN